MFACVLSGGLAMPTVNRKGLQPPLLLLTALLGLPPIAQQHGAQQGPDIVWTWSAQCNTNQQLRVAIRLGSTLL